jgi:rod shape determining protein RodA
MLLLDRRYIRSFDWLGFIIILILSIIGLFLVFSATYKVDQPFSLFFKKQLFGMLSGLIIYFVCCFLDYRTLERAGYFFYFAIIVLLFFTIIKGSIGMGAQRWISLGIIKFQPSELAKLFFPAFFSHYIYTSKDILTFNFYTIIPILSILGLSTLLIIKQPDLGTGLVVLFSGITLLWVAGVNKKFFLYSLLISTLATPILWKCLKPYQKKRVEVFFGGGDSKRERYQIEQSRIAIGSGGITGKGFLKGTQNKLQFLPESRTDFIFSVLAEELGFLGALGLVILYVLLFLRAFSIIRTIKNFYVQILACGLIMHIIFSTIINISMVMGLLPIVGIPLPFISYGISNLWITFASLGWFNGIAMRRFYLSASVQN